MLSDIVDVLRCPYCQKSLALDGRVMACANRHSFDIAREGYLNLLPGTSKTTSGDTPGMVDARQAFLAAGHYAPIATALVVAALAAQTSEPDGVVLDVGAGTGYYLAALLDGMPQRHGIALDLSKRAARVAARSHPRASAIVADVWAPLPLMTASAAIVACVFSPRNAPEFARVLSSDGILLVVTPEPDHLAELIGPLGLLTVDPRKDERLSVKLGSDFELADSRHVTSVMRLTRPEAVAVAAMGPAAAHAASGELEKRAESLPDITEVTQSVVVRTYRPTPQPNATSSESST